MKTTKKAMKAMPTSAIHELLETMNKIMTDGETSETCIITPNSENGESSSAKLTEGAR